ncbi:MBL fold metallo-hydrolase [Leptolyngbya sp. FACHB-16]|uniref:MBL fold metallo-hydrolase n=1 Tax=unclassified Leptolyngbya TaxID=2650499 RepID=UPI00168457E5|nr:MBL fold metallo-hydrolase [Leptolyngbya sp. FACHB-16]MBD2153035.1 MBL fold metallo-hydrolase [Leptolyngbya sp. FACHB-16]
MNLTYLDSNSWLIELGNTRILLDPWLVGDLVLGGTPWLFRASRSTPHPIPEHVDLILLSQGLADHAHPETLKVLDRTIPVVASPSAAKIVTDLGYQQVTALAHGEWFDWQGRLTIQAFPGSPIGPFLTENAYLLADTVQQERLYYEPHGYHHPSLQQEKPVDVVITPLINAELPLVGPIIKGQDSALTIAQWLRPQVMLPTAAGGDVEYEGVLLTLLREVGTLEAVQTLLQENGLSTRVLQPKSGDRLDLTFAASNPSTGS